VRAGIVIWVAQLAFLGYFFADLTWQNYWWCRWLYRPGLRAFSALMGGILPGYYFNPFSRTGVIAGFLFASLLYTAIAVGGAMLVQRVAPVGVAVVVKRR
jgi:hypothetical protein